MKFSLLTLVSAAITGAKAFYAMSIFAPQYPQVHGRGVNARGHRFIIGAETPSTYCGLTNNQCPPGDKTLIDKDMTLLAASVPGGQFIFVSPLGSISYPSAHSSLRPPGSKIGGFRPARIEADNNKLNITVLFWEPEDGYNGLWACPTSPGVPIWSEAELKATTELFFGYGCVPVLAVQIRDAGNEFAAWAYT